MYMPTNSKSLTASSRAVLWAILSTERESEQSIAVGDGANDLPMLSTAGLGIAFHAKPKVKQTARQSISTIGLDGVLYFLGFKDSYILS